MVIRSEEGLSRDMVKHLNSIEEQILESLAWTNNSALWDALHASANKVPSCEEVSQGLMKSIIFVFCFYETRFLYVALPVMNDALHRFKPDVA